MTTCRRGRAPSGSFVDSACAYGPTIFENMSRAYLRDELFVFSDEVRRTDFFKRYSDRHGTYDVAHTFCQPSARMIAPRVPAFSRRFTRALRGRGQARARRATADREGEVRSLRPALAAVLTTCEVCDSRPATRCRNSGSG